MTFYIMTSIAIIILIALSGFFSSGETAVTAANRIKLKSAAESGNRRAAIAKLLTDDFPKTLSTILVSNSLVNITASTLATLFFTGLWGDTALSESVSAILITVLLLIFGEIYPKIIAAEYCDSYVLFCAPFVRVMTVIFKPLVSFVGFMIKKLSVLWTPKEASPTATTEELVSIVEEIEDVGGFTETESDIIRGAINFTEKTAKEIITPRVDILAFDIEDDISELAANTALLEYARFPVYRESLDHIIGVMNTRTFACEYLKHGRDIDIEKLLIKPVYVHMTREISSILREMREKKCEMAVVLDEFGGTLGIITVEDIVEEIVGEIYDESDEPEQLCTEKDNVYEIDGGMNIYDFFDIIGYNDHAFESEYTTMGGWAAEVLNKIPEEGDQFDFDYLTVKVTKVDNMRVEKLTVTVNEKPDEEEEE